MWRDRRWRDLLNLIDWLPRNSAYMEAITEDDEVAEEILSRPQKKQTVRPRISEWSPELEKLTDTVDRLGEVMQAVVAAAGSKPPKVRPQPRPRTAIDRLREKKRMEHHRKVVSRVLIQRPDGSVAPMVLGGPPSKSAKAPAFQPKKVALLPGEDPFRLKSPRRKPPPEAAPEQQ